MSHVLADNIVALIILPCLTPEQQTDYGGNAGSLASGYSYDSSKATSLSLTPSGQTTLNQLPPLVQVTMVAIDETSAVHLQAQYGAGTAPPLTNNLFTAVNTISDYENDLSQLEANLQQTAVNGKSPAIHLNIPASYQVFTSNIRITGARWSTDTNN